jgi:hypothetical protein
MRRNSIIAVVLLLAFGTAEAAAVVSRSGKVVKTRKHRHRRVVWNPVLRGSYDSMLRQNEEIDRLALMRIQNDDELQNMILRQELLELNDSEGILIASNLDVTRRYSRPWTRDFVNDLGRSFYAEFRRPIQITSAVRTMEQQKKLRRRNRNAAPIDGEVASSHLAGTTVDIGKRGLSRKQKKWLEQYLKDLQDQGYIEAAEERRQACFHVMVLQRYSELRQSSVAEELSEATD